nr:hypothetical protein CFP56_63363 [Quercus suber]POE94793.1 hypothetical protein CFP56_17030 [Quercus suber]
MAQIQIWCTRAGGPDHSTGVNIRGYTSLKLEVVQRTVLEFLSHGGGRARGGGEADDAGSWKGRKATAYLNIIQLSTPPPCPHHHCYRNARTLPSSPVMYSPTMTCTV